MPHRLLATPLRRKVNGAWVDTTLQPSHVRLYLVIQSWERTRVDGMRVPCAASWRQIVEQWPGEAPEVRTLQRHLRELCGAGWVTEVQCVRRGGTVRGLLTVRAAEFVAAHPRADVTPPAPSKITPFVTPDITPRRQDHPPPDVRITPVLYSEEVEGCTPYHHPDGARDPGATEQAPQPGAGAGGPLLAAPQESEQTPEPRPEDVRRRTNSARSTPLPRELIGLALSRKFVSDPDFSDEEIVAGVRDVELAYRGDWARVRHVTATVKSAILARRRGEPWGKRLAPAATAQLPPRPVETAPDDLVQEQLRQLRALRGGDHASEA